MVTDGSCDVSQELLSAAEVFVRKELQEHDASHVCGSISVTGLRSGPTLAVLGWHVRNVYVCILALAALYAGCAARAPCG
jgi:hypothetical protein